MNSETVAVYHSHGAAEDAIRRLRKSASDPKNITVVAEDYQCQEHIVGYYNMLERIAVWARIGALAGAVGGLFLARPLVPTSETGAVILADSWLSAILCSLEGAALIAAIAAISAAIYSLTIPKDTVLRYHKETGPAQFRLIAQGTTEEISAIRKCLSGIRRSTGNEEPNTQGRSGDQPCLLTRPMRRRVLQNTSWKGHPKESNWWNGGP